MVTAAQQSSHATVSLMSVMRQTSPTFYNELSSLVQHIPKHNVLIISGNTNAHIGNSINNKLYIHNLPNRTG